MYVSHLQKETILSKFANLIRCRRLLALMLCFVVMVLEGINLSLPGPFFPREAKNKGKKIFDGKIFIYQKSW